MPERVDWSRVSHTYKYDVLEYGRDNGKFLPGQTDEQFLEGLEPKTALHYWLTWNGIVGYTETILDLVRQLGAK